MCTTVVIIRFVSSSKIVLWLRLSLASFTTGSDISLFPFLNNSLNTLNKMSLYRVHVVPKRVLTYHILVFEVLDFRTQFVLVPTTIIST